MPVSTCRARKPVQRKLQTTRPRNTRQHYHVALSVFKHSSPNPLHPTTYTPLGRGILYKTNVYAPSLPFPSLPSQLVFLHRLIMGCAHSKPSSPAPRPPRFPANWPDPRQFAVLAAQAEDEHTRLSISRASIRTARNSGPYNWAILRKKQDGGCREPGLKGESSDEIKGFDYGVFGRGGEAGTCKQSAVVVPLTEW